MDLPVDISAIAANLKPGPDGIWVAAGPSGGVSYPEEGNENCLALEADSFWFVHRNRCIQALVENFPPPGALFDLGGGNGYVAIGLQQAGVPVVLVEPGRQGVQNARQRGVKGIICSTLEDAGFRPATLPAVGTFDVLEHIAGDVNFLEKVHTLLAPGGRLYLTVPAFPALWSVDDQYAGHYRRYRLGALRRAVEQARFTVEYASYFFFLLPLPILLGRTIPTLFGLRKQEEWGRYQDEHHRQAGLVGYGLNTLLNGELAWIRRKRALPLGGSCLLAARKKPER